VTLVAVGAVAFACAFGIARVAGDDTSASSATVDARPLALRTASSLPALRDEEGPTDAELQALREARREKAEERARKRELARKKREKLEAAEKEAVREDRARLRAQRKAERQAVAEREQEAAERNWRPEQQEEAPSWQPEQITPGPAPPTTTTPAPVGEEFDDSG
jgi:hypothetical protein